MLNRQWISIFSTSSFIVAITYLLICFLINPEEFTTIYFNSLGVDWPLRQTRTSQLPALGFLMIVQLYLITWYLGSPICTLSFGMIGGSKLGVLFLSCWKFFWGLLSGTIGECTWPLFFLSRPSCYNSDKSYCWLLHTLLVNFAKALRFRC